MMNPFNFALGLVLVALVRGHGPRVAYTKPPTPKGVASQSIDYTYDGHAFEGFIAFPKPSDGAPTRAGPLPGALVGHTWMGLGEMEKFRSEQLASYGYVVFALDVYGKGIRPTTPQEAQGNMTHATEDVQKFYGMLDAGMTQLKRAGGVGPAVNATGLFANGYCFGGQMVLELARMGYAGLVGVASFHGELGNLTSQENDNFKAGIQVHHADLGFQGAGALLAFEDEVRSHKTALWTTTKYGNCKHGWTDPTNAVYRPFEANLAHSSMFAMYSQLQGLA